MISSIGRGADSVDLASLKQMREQMFSKLDADGDGKVTAAELQEAEKSGNGRGPSAAGILKTLDGDGDGAITKAETESAFAQLDSKMKTVLIGAQESAGRPAGGRGGDMKGPPPAPEEVFDALDTNQDGFVDAEELSQQSDGPSADELLALFDSDGDGKISEQEHKNGGEQMAEARGPGGPPPSQERPAQASAAAKLSSADAMALIADLAARLQAGGTAG